MIYDSFERKYNDKGQLHGKVTYYKEGNIVTTSTYKNGKPYNGVFYEQEYLKNRYQNGMLVKSYYNVEKYQIEEEYEKGEITNVVVRHKKTFYKGAYRNGKPYAGIFLAFDDFERPTKYTISIYKDGLKNGIEDVFRLSKEAEKRMNRKWYQNGELLKQTWELYKNKIGEKLTGRYKNTQHFSGDFYEKNNENYSILHYENGQQEGMQYYGEQDDDRLEELGKVWYKNGKAINGEEVLSINDKIHVHSYVNGNLAITRIYNWKINDRPNAVINYSNTGFVTLKENRDNQLEKYNELQYANKKQQNGTLKFYKNNKEIGKVTIENNQITAFSIAFSKHLFDIEMLLEKGKEVHVFAKSKAITIKIHPIIDLQKSINYKTVFNFDGDLLKSDGIAYFYLGKQTTSISSCTVEKGQEQNGVVVNYNKENKKYYYKKYKNGKRVKKVRHLTKKQLLKALKNE